MVVFKFGGASVKDAESVRNVAAIINRYGYNGLMVVVSAIGKTTNALEEIATRSFRGEDASVQIENLKTRHITLASELFGEKDPVFEAIGNLIAEIYWAVEDEQKYDYDFFYDQVVSVGELLSTLIVSSYLKKCGIPVQYLDARDLIRTDNCYREANVDWVTTSKLIKDTIRDTSACYLTQGFIAGTSENFTTTLGREGSDYSAAILAYCIDATQLTIWKDVPGVLNANPGEKPDAVLLPSLSYSDATELAYYGATVIHPKTIKPLQNKKIQLLVKSFNDPEKPGTEIIEQELRQSIPTFIFKRDQTLISLMPRDFSFVVENHLSEIFRQLALHRIKVNLMQNSALNFSICVTAEKERLRHFVEVMEDSYRVLFNENCLLITIRNYSEEHIQEYVTNKELLLEQRSRTTAQLVLRDL